MHVSTLRILRVLTTKTFLICSLRTQVTVELLFLYSCIFRLLIVKFMDIPSLLKSLHSRPTLVMNGWKLGCPSYVKLNVVSLNCPGWRKEWMVNFELVKPKLAMLVVLIEIRYSGRTFPHKISSVTWLNKMMKGLFPYPICRGNVFRLGRTDQWRQNRWFCSNWS